MKNITYTLAILSIFSYSSFATSNTMDVPYDCGLEPSVFSYNPNNISAAINAGSEIYQESASYLDWASLFSAVASVYSSSTMSTEGPDYVLQGTSARFKYDGSWFDWSSRFFTVHFGTSEFGSEVSTTSNLDNNAYKNLTFNYTYGPGLVWSSADGCMAKPVLVQKKPEITSANSYSSDGNIKADISYVVDQYSQAGQELATNVKITLKIISDLYKTRSDTTVYNSSIDSSVTVTIPPNAGGGLYSITAIVSDGNYSDSFDMGDVYVPGKVNPPCRDCNPY